MKREVKVWDPLVRIFHWSLIIFFFIGYFTGEEESDLHIIAGYTVLGLITFRVLWGLIGPKYARFSNFIYSPSTVMQYAKDMLNGHAKPYVGHNPLGGMMIIALLVSLFAVSYSGLKVYAIEEGLGPLATPTTVTFVKTAQADDDEDEEHEGEEDEAEEFWEEIHEFFANFLLLLIALHVTGVIVASHREKQHLVKAMITGKKEVEE